MNCQTESGSGGISTAQESNVEIIETVIPVDAPILSVEVETEPSLTEQFLALFEDKNPLVLALMIALVLAVLKDA